MVVKKKIAKKTTSEASNGVTKVTKKRAAKRIEESPASSEPTIKATSSSTKSKTKKSSSSTKKTISEPPVKMAKLFDDDDEEDAEFALPEESDDDVMDDAFDSDDNDDESGDDNELPIEKKSRELDRKKAKVAAEGEEELQLNIAGQEQFKLPSVEEVEEEMKTAPSLQLVKDRIRDVIQVLGDFKNRREGGKSRTDYIDILTKDLCTQYGYNEYLLGKFLQLFPVGAELLEFLDANDQPRPVTIRTNTLKTRRGDLAKTLINRGMNVDPAASWTKVGLVVYDSQVPVGATPEYLAGHYMIQGLNSLLPVMALAPQPGDRVLDMCSAPGGKTSHIAALMKNSGVLFANDANMQRCKAIIGNLHRLGVNNAVVSNLNGEEFSKVAPNGFDRILLDAPCSGTGVIWKDSSVKTSKDSQDIQKRHTVQRQLLVAAMDALDANSPNGGYLVYSTCSVLVEENEAVVDFILKKRHCELVPTGLEIGVDGYTKFRDYRFHPSLNLTKRYYPHVHNIDGFYVAKIKKLSNAKMGKASVDIDHQEKVANKKKKSKSDDSDSDEEVDNVKRPGSGQRAAKKRRNQKKCAEKQALLEEDGGFNVAGYVKKGKKEKVFKSRVAKRSLARSSAKMVKNKRKKMMAKAARPRPSSE